MSMNAAVFDGPGLPLRIAQVDSPVAQAGELLLRVARCGVCGNDMQATAAGSPLGAGAVIGHEFCGTVIAVGASVTGWAAADRVVAMPFVGCGTCAECQAGRPIWCRAMRSHAFGQVSGGFGEIVAVAARNTVKLPDHMTWDQAALVEPLAVGLHGLRRAGLENGARVLVLGAGPVGLSTALWAKAFGASHVAVAAPSAHKADLAAQLGLDHFLVLEGDVRAAFRARAGGPIDVVLECSGAPGALQNAIALVRPRGAIGVVAGCGAPDPVRPKEALRKELSLFFSLAYGLDDFRESVAHIANGDIDPLAMITARVGLAGFPAAFEGLRTPGHQCKVLLCHET